MTEPKPGIKTTELWLSAAIGALLVGLSVFLETAGSHLGGAAAAIAATVAPSIYAAGRSKLKLEEAKRGPNPTQP